MPDSPPPPEDVPFEDALQRLEALVEQLETGEDGLEASLDAYEEGVTMARHCLQRLQQAELRVQELGLE